MIYKLSNNKIINPNYSIHLVIMEYYYNIYYNIFDINISNILGYV